MDDEGLRKQIGVWVDKIKGLEQGGYEEDDISKIKGALRVISEDVGNIVLGEEQENTFETVLANLKEGISSFLQRDLELKSFKTSFAKFLQSDPLIAAEALSSVESTKEVQSDTESESKPENLPPDPPPKSETQPEEKPEEPPKELAASVPTIERIKGLLGEDFQKQLGEHHSKYLTTIEAIEQGVPEGQETAFANLKTRLEGNMSVPDGIDFTKKESIDEALKKQLATALGAENDEEKIKEALQKMGIEDEQIAATQEALENFIMMRMMTSQYQRMDTSKEFDLKAVLNGVQNRAKSITPFRVMDKELIDHIKSGQKLEAPVLEKIVKQSHKISEGLYSYRGQDGKPNVLMTKINKENIQKTIDTLSNNKTITWHGLNDKQKMTAEIECCRRGKRAMFEQGGQKVSGPYSKHMPENPENFAKWYKNIVAEEKKLARVGHKPSWQHGAGHPSSQGFVQEVVDNDPDTLKAFWQDITLNDPSGKLREQAQQQLTSDQRKTLQKYLEKGPDNETKVQKIVRKEQLDQLEVKKPEPTEPKKGQEQPTNPATMGGPTSNP